MFIRGSRPGNTGAAVHGPQRDRRRAERIICRLSVLLCVLPGFPPACGIREQHGGAESACVSVSRYLAVHGPSGHGRWRAPVCWELRWAAEIQ